MGTFLKPMELFTILICLSLICASCNSHDNRGAGGTDTLSTSRPVLDDNERYKSGARNPDAIEGEASLNLEQGRQLIASSDCTSCHSENNDMVGPAYIKVAGKYKPTKANVDALANKIIEGGSGNWGKVPMTAHPDVSFQEAQGMVKYILSL